MRQRGWHVLSRLTLYRIIAIILLLKLQRYPVTILDTRIILGQPMKSLNRLALLQLSVCCESA